MKLTDRLTIPAAVIARQVGEETVILDLAGGSYYGLDAVGTRIWQLLGEGRPLGQVLDVMLVEYDVSIEDMERDLIRLLQELSDKKLIVFST